MGHSYRSRPREGPAPLLCWPASSFHSPYAMIWSLELCIALGGTNLGALLVPQDNIVLGGRGDTLRGEPKRNSPRPLGGDFNGVALSSGAFSPKRT